MMRYGFCRGFLRTLCPALRRAQEVGTGSSEQKIEMNNEGIRENICCSQQCAQTIKMTVPPLPHKSRERSDYIYVDKDNGCVPVSYITDSRVISLDIVSSISIGTFC